MSEKIDKTLKKLAGDISKVSSRTSSNTDDVRPASAGNIGDPNCPHCGGQGFLRRDLPVDHPDFGKLEVCPCRYDDVNRQVRKRLFSLSHLNELRHLTFENFEQRGRVGLWPNQALSLERAYNLSKQFAISLKGWLLLQGGYGSGKTHLAAAIANFAVEMGVPTLFITVPDLLDSLRFSYHDPSSTFEERFDEIRQAPLLILDDFGTQNATSWAQEKLFQIINYRYINRLPLVVTTNLAPEEVENRIGSRLQDPELVTEIHILAPDYRRPVKDIGHHELSSLSLLHDRTFASFDLRKGEGLPKGDLENLEKALKVAQEFNLNPHGWLVFTGTYGCGKTHLAAAIANSQAEKGNPPLFIVVPDLLDHLRATFNPNSMITLDRRFEEVRTAPLLILDDLGTQSMTPWVREKLYQLFNYRYNAELPTIITTADPLDQVDPRLRSRMLDRRICQIYAITAPSYSGAPRKDNRRTAKRGRTVYKD